MRSPEELDTIDWPSLGQAYGNGSDVPGWIRALYSDDRDQARTAVFEFFSRALHQGSVSSAAVAAVPFLAHAAMHTIHEWVAVLAALAGCGGTEAEPEYDDEVQGCARIAAEVTGLLHLLRGDDPLVRRTMVRVARRATGETVPAVLRELATCYASDPAAAVRAEALTVLTLLDPDESAAHRRLRSALTDPVPAVRAAAALALLERSEAPFPADVVAVLAEAGGDPGFDVGTHEFAPGIGTADERAWILTEDADALATVARGWITRGDHQGRGTRRARHLSAMWRDREDETVSLLTAALPHKHALWDLDTLLGTISQDLLGASRPDPALGDNLLPHVHTDTLAARQAQTILGHLGDPRLLTDIPEPAPEALAALAVRTRNPEHQRLALRHPDGTHVDGLYSTLSAEEARTHLPDLTQLLRHHPTRTLVHRFADWAIRDTELLDLLEALSRTTGDDDLATAATVTAARLTGDPKTALHRLTPRLADSGRQLEEAGRLGSAAAPLLPLVERYLDSGDGWTRLHAAEAHWRITGDPSAALPVLAALVNPSLPVGLRALQALHRIGPPYPPDLQPHLLHWATSERRLLHEYGICFPAQRHRDDELRETARRMLGWRGRRGRPAPAGE
ncbi:hypothetical protein ACFU7Y_39360 [Kitasatospora sp. NPDC057542]|uniref:hypothetical protein n=1 Tax=Kitasatospora sp. NPDC057542 TaxID=3346162 RepID=UPI00367433D8